MKSGTYCVDVQVEGGRGRLIADKYANCQLLEAELR